MLTHLSEEDRAAVLPLGLPSFGDFTDPELVLSKTFALDLTVHEHLECSALQGVQLVSATSEQARTSIWDLCHNCGGPLLASFQDAQQVAQGMLNVPSAAGLARDLGTSTFAAAGAAEIRIAGAMLASGVLSWTGMLPFGRRTSQGDVVGGLKDLRNIAWGDQRLAELELSVAVARAAFREQFETVAVGTRSTPDQHDQLLLVRDATMQLLSGRSGANLRAWLVAYDWVAGGPDGTWAVIRLPERYLDARYARGALRAEVCFDLGPSARSTPELWVAFEQTYTNDVPPDVAFQTALAIVDSPAFAAA